MEHLTQSHVLALRKLQKVAPEASGDGMRNIFDIANNTFGDLEADLVARARALMKRIVACDQHVDSSSLGCEISDFLRMLDIRFSMNGSIGLELH